MVSRRPVRLLVTAAALAVAAAVSLVSAGPVQAQSAKDAMLTVRSIDGTDKAAVGVTFLWTGDPQALENLTLREDGRDARIDDLTLLRKTDKRLATVYLVDLSGSMADDGALSAAKAAITARAAQLPEGDQMAVVSFTDNVVVETTFTSDKAQIDAAVEQLAAPRDGKRAMFEGIRKAASLFADRPDLQPNLVMITDGANDVAGSDPAQARAAVASSGAAFFAVDLRHAARTDVDSAVQSIELVTGPVAQWPLRSAPTDVDPALASVDATSCATSTSSPSPACA